MALQTYGRILCLWCCVIFASCDFVKGVQTTMGDLFAKKNQIQSPKKNPVTKKEPDPATKTETNLDEPPAEAPAAEVAGDEKETMLPRTRETRIAPQVYDESIPLKPVNHLGGRIGAVFLDDAFLYVAMGRTLYGLDDNLKIKTSINLEAPITAINSINVDGGKRIYVSEWNNILEVVEVLQGQFKHVKSFKVDGAFDRVYNFTAADGSPSHQIFVLLPDKIQTLGLDKQEVEIIGETSIANAWQVLPTQDYLFVVEGTNLKIVSRLHQSVKASIPVGEPFELLGIYQEKSSQFLLMALNNLEQKAITALQLIPLTQDGSGIADLGKKYELTNPIRAIVLDGSLPLAYLMGDGFLEVFDLQNKKLFQSGKAEFKNVQTLAGAANKLVLSTASTLYKTTLALEEEKPAEPPLQPDTTLTPHSPRIVFSAMVSEPTLYNPREIYLLGGPALLAYQKPSGEAPAGPAFFHAPDFSQKIFPIPKAAASGAESLDGLTVRLIQSNLVGQKNGKFYKISFDPKTQKITLEAMASGDPEAENAALKSKIKPGNEGTQILDVRPAPNKKLAYALYKTEENLSLGVIDLNPPSPVELSVIKNVELESLQGISFSKGGNSLILPTKQGLSVYDMTNPKTPKELYQWKIGPATFVDVTDRGRTVCAAVGEIGIECARFKEQEKN